MRSRIRFHSGGADDATRRSPTGQIGQQGCLADAGLPAQNERAAVSSAHVEHQLIEDCLFPRRPRSRGDDG